MSHTAPSIADAKDAELETVCDLCDGSGGNRDSGAWADCPWCFGSGKKPTAAGEKLLKLVKNNLRRLNHELSEERRS